MSGVDVEAVNNANKGLSIIFILGILAVNAALLFKIYRKNNKFWYNAKHLTLVSLAIGDIFLALFSLVVIAKVSFEGTIDSCSTTLSSSIYQQYLITFVFGVGLCVLALEVVMRQRNPISSSSNNQRDGLVKAFLYSALPWFLGLIIILPLTMAGISWDDARCGYTSITLGRLRAMFWVSILLPAGLSFVSCIVIMCMRSSPQPAQQMVLAPTTTVTVSAPPPSYPDSNNANDSSKSAQQPTATTPGYNNYQYPQQNAGYQYPPQAPNQYPQYAPNQYNNAGYQPPPQPYVYQAGAYIPAQGYIAQPMTSTPAYSDVSKEKNVLMWASILFCFCVIPLAGFNLGYTLHSGRTYYWDQLPVTVVTMVFQWLTILRSFITPMLWLGTTTL